MYSNRLCANSVTFARQDVRLHYDDSRRTDVFVLKSAVVYLDGTQVYTFFFTSMTLICGTFLQLASDEATDWTADHDRPGGGAVLASVNLDNL